jgi:hypothetical protein
MAIYLGNLSIEKMEERLGIIFPQELKTFLQDKHQDNAGKLALDKWHCFDAPFVLNCQNREMAQIIYDYLKPLEENMKGQMNITIQD